MKTREFIPVVIGVGEIKNRSVEPKDAIEPAELMLKAILSALEDTGTSSSASQTLKSQIDHLGVVNTWTWRYRDLPTLLCENLGVEKKRVKRVLSHHGGDSPAKLFDEAARSIARGECKVAVVVGGEALASRECSIFLEVAVRSCRCVAIETFGDYIECLTT